MQLDYGRTLHLKRKGSAGFQPAPDGILPAGSSAPRLGFPPISRKQSVCVVGKDAADSGLEARAPLLPSQLHRYGSG